MPAMFYLMTSPISLFLRRVSKKYLAPSIYSYPYWRLKSNIRFYKGVFCLFGHPRCILLSELKVSTVESDLFIFSLLPIVRLSAGSDEIFFGTDFNILFISCRPVFGSQVGIDIGFLLCDIVRRDVFFLAFFVLHLHFTDRNIDFSAGSDSTDRLSDTSVLGWVVAGTSSNWAANTCPVSSRAIILH